MNNYDNFFLPTNDLKKSTDFYESLGLSLKFNMIDKGMVALSCQNEEPAIILKDINKFPNLKPTIWFEVENTLEEYKRLQAKGINFLSEPFEIGTGISVEFEDPYGNRLGITDYRK